MIEPTESYSLEELDRFAEAVKTIGSIAREHPEVLKRAPHFTPIDRVDEVAANRTPVVSEPLRNYLDQSKPSRPRSASIHEHGCNQGPPSRLQVVVHNSKS